jgi:hypothetical protein
MSFYALGTIVRERQAELVRLCRQQSTMSVQQIIQLVGTRKVLIEWNSRPAITTKDKNTLIRSIEAAVESFEALDVPLVYFYRVSSNKNWEEVERSLFRNLLQSDLKTWHKVKNFPD